MVEDALSFWTEIQRYEDMLATDAKNLCFAPLSELYRKLGLLDDAIMVAEKGCAAHPDLPAGFLALGTACYAKGLTGQARNALERAVALEPNHLEALKLLGQLYVEQNEVVLARKVLEQVLQQDPDDLESSLLLNSVAVTPSQEEPEEVLENIEIIEELEEVVEEDFAAPLRPAVEPARPQAPAAAAPLEDDDIWAIEDLEEVEVEPLPPQRSDAATPDPLTTATLAELYVSQGFVEKALGIYRELITAHPSNSQYRLRCAELQEMLELQQMPVESAGAAKGPAAATAPAAELLEDTDDFEAGWDVPVEPEGMAEAERNSELVIPAALETPAKLEFPATAEAAFAIESPAVMEEPALEVLETRSAPTGGAGEAEVELQRWLENIRRRKDGV
ncbi:TPR domain protein [Citrifermentans bemidjiense Bem]|uniref:TPR domain protein n=1 Tax=Citrifermentans bemidjiense (strain ATCC BAA-1014 / DSM 16622 / JCM 12645 / Bem) TaxID=404380 RepID=B5E8J0_CITBB|nr:tetratricopeptide repeat protein [Citrifermentans bemidjiense]ACH38575.1 TPR domain protein [Citrifermentans bemidjiense Bem]